MALIDLAEGQTDQRQTRLYEKLGEGGLYGRPRFCTKLLQKPSHDL